MRARSTKPRGPNWSQPWKRARNARANGAWRWKFAKRCANCLNPPRRRGCVPTCARRFANRRRAANRAGMVSSRACARSCGPEAWDWPRSPCGLALAVNFPNLNPRPKPCNRPRWNRLRRTRRQRLKRRRAHFLPNPPRHRAWLRRRKRNPRPPRPIPSSNCRHRPPSTTRPSPRRRARRTQTW